MSESIWKKIGVDPKNMSPQEAAYLKGFLYEYKKNMARFNSEYSQNYFHNLIAAIMLEYRRFYENNDIRIPYRIKSVKSVLDKIAEYLARDDKRKVETNGDGDFQMVLKEELSDMFGMTIVTGKRPPVLASNDPEIKALIKEREVNRVALANVQGFKLGITCEEFSGKNSASYNYQESRQEYYLKCIFLLNKIKNLVHPNATDLLNKYDSMLEKIKQNVPKAYFDFVNSLLDDPRVLAGLDTPEKLKSHFELIRLKLENCGMSKSEKECMEGRFLLSDVGVSNFLELLDDFSARIDDQLDLAMLSKQVHSLFETSETLKQFGVELVTDKDKEKRTARGYVSNFLTLQTPYGKIEIQLQSDHEHREGNYGYAAHSDISGKSIEPFKIPKEGDEQALKDFRLCVELFSAKKFLAKYDDAEKDRVLTQVFGKYQNYKSIMMQVQRGTEHEKQLEEYFLEIYNRKFELFDGEAKQDHVEGFTPFDINNFLRSHKLAIDIEEPHEEK